MAWSDQVANLDSDEESANFFSQIRFSTKS